MKIINNLCQMRYNLVFVSVFYLHSSQSLNSLENVEEIKQNEIVKETDKDQKDQSGHWSSNNQICKTKECTKFGKEYLLLINQSVNPCDDFYEYVCGKYSRNMPIPPDMTSVGVFQTGDERIEEILRKELCQQNSKSDSFSIIYATDMYSACADQKTTEWRDVKPLVKALLSIGGWPLINNIIPFNELGYNKLESLARFIAFYGESAIVDISVSPDLKNTSRNALYISPSTQIHVGTNLRNETSGIYIPTTPPIMTGKLKRKNTSQQSFTDLVINHIFRQVLIMGGEATLKTLQQIIDVIGFYSQLSQIQTPGLDLRSQYNRMKIKKLIELSGGKIDWLNFLNRIFELSGSKKRLTEDDYCIVTDVQYIKKLPSVIFRTPKKVFANFLGQILVNDFGVYTVEAFRKLDFQLVRSLYHVEKQEPHWEFCVSTVRNLMGFAISRKYVQDNFSPNAKLMITRLVNYISDAFYQLIQKNTILDEYSRGRALTKLRAIKKNVAYPEWIFDNKILDSLYALELQCNTKMFFECVTYLLMRMQFRMLNQYKEPVNKEIASVAFDPTIINAAYDPTQNSITVGTGIINALKFSSDDPRQVLYGKLGVIIGHELTHGFDQTGRQFDERGNLKSIFDAQTEQNFDRKEMCFVNEYNKFCENGFCVDGQNTLGENTADNGGMREAFKAYKMCNQNEGEAQRLPYVSQYTPDQIYFIAYATLWCENIRPEYLPVIYSDVHSPGRFRVNGVVANFKPFADSFKCPINSRMNPKNKCIVW